MAHRFALALALVAGCSSNAFAAPPAKTDVKLVSIGESHSFVSDALGEERTINVYLPPNYSDPNRKFPVLYVVDGGLDQDFMHVVGTSHLGAVWARSQEVIVVGIATKDRRKELTAPTGNPELLKEFPQAGYSGFFLKHLAEEVKPFIARSFRVNGQDAIIGESLAGMFVVEAYLRQPDLFDAYAAISPSLWWDDQRLAKQAEGLMKIRKKGTDPRLYLSIANEGGDMQHGMDRVVRALHGRKNWCYTPRKAMRHDTIYHQSMALVLQYLFPTDTPVAPESGFKIRCDKKG